VGEPGYDPQFPYGYGLSYAAPRVIPVLSEEPGRIVVEPNVARYFAAGRTPEPFSLAATGEVALRAIDAGAQENGREARWSGPGAIEITGPQLDLSRQTTGDMALLIRYRIDQAPGAPVTLSVTCGPKCGAGLDVTSLLSKGPTHEWRTLKVRLACFRSKGAQMERVTSPFRLETTAPFTFTFTDLRLDYNQGDALCPS
jgi:beta-glucosidase